jgi:hypothetical protein
MGFNSAFKGLIMKLLTHLMSAGKLQTLWSYFNMIKIEAEDSNNFAENADISCDLV